MKFRYSMNYRSKIELMARQIIFATVMFTFSTNFILEDYVFTLVTFVLFFWTLIPMYPLFKNIYFTIKEWYDLREERKKNT